jgi:hypothetical protein
LSALGKSNNAAIDKALGQMAKEKKSCDKACDATKAEKESDKAMMSNLKEVCDKEIGNLETQVGAGKSGNTAADKGGNDTAKSAANDNKQQSAPASAMPPITPPSSPSSDSNKDQTPPPTADNSQTAPTPAAQPQAAQADNKTGSAGFKTASQQAIASVCGSSSNPSEISGCPTSAAVAEGAPASPFPTASSASSALGGGSASGSGGSSINAAQVAAALAGQNKNGESEKDGKNSGLKAASINLGTDGGGGGGGGGSSASGSLPDFDFGMKPASAARRPASTGGSSESVTTVAGNTSVATQRFSVVKIVTEVYQDRCSKSRFLHCGTNK